MRTSKWIAMSWLALMLVAVMACKETPTGITSLKFGKDKDATTPATNYATVDTVYAVAEVSSPGKVKVTGRLIVDDVEGQTKGPIPGLETTIDLASTGTANFTFTPPPAGWPKGKYSLEVVVVDDAGAQKDKKSGSFTVS